MNNKRLLILFMLHFFVILIHSLYGFFVQLASNKEESIYQKPISYLNVMVDILNNPISRPYMILSGAETGYGFYGKNVATTKFIMIEFYDKDSTLLQTVDFGQAFLTKNGVIRYETLPSKIYNFINDTDELNQKLINTDSVQAKLITHQRNEYVEKVFKYIAKSSYRDHLLPRMALSSNTFNSTEYIITKLITIYPPENIFSNRSENQSIYILKEYQFPKL